MPRIRIVVVDEYGKKVTGQRVVLGFSGFGGSTSPRFTDSSGGAEFDINAGQGGTVYVNGQDRGHFSYTDGSKTCRM